MINPIAVVKLLNEKKEFEKNHPDFYAFLHSLVTENAEAGTEIEIRVKKPGEEEKNCSLNIQDSDIATIEKLKEALGVG